MTLNLIQDNLKIRLYSLKWSYLNMKLVTLFCIGLSLFLPPMIHGISYPLSLESQMAMHNAGTRVGLIGAGLGWIAGGALGVAVGAYVQRNDRSFQRKTTWQKFKASWHYAVVPAVIGAFGGGYYGYSSGSHNCYLNTPEYILEDAQKSMSAIENDAIFNQALAAKTIQEVKNLNPLADYPTVKAYEKISSLYQNLMNLKPKFVSVVNSGIKPLADTSEAILKQIKAAEEKLVKILIKLKKDTSYLPELQQAEQIKHNSAMLATQKMLVNEQARLASAAESQAHAAWTAALRCQQKNSN